MLRVKESAARMVVVKYIVGLESLDIALDRDEILRCC